MTTPEDPLPPPSRDDSKASGGGKGGTPRRDWRSRVPGWLRRGLRSNTLRGVVVLALCTLALLHYGRMLDAAYAIKDWAFWPIAQMWLYNAVFFAACFSAGIRVMIWLRVQSTALERFAFAMPTGVIAFCLCMYALGAVGLFKRPAAIVLAVLLLASGAVPAVRFARRALTWWVTPEPRAGNPMSRLLRAAALGYGVVCLALLYLPVLTPETLNYDSQWCHLTVAQDYAREGHIVRYDGDYARNHPQLAPFLHTWFWLLPVPSLLQRWTLPLHTEFFMVVFTLPGIAATVRYLLHQKRVPMSWMAFFLFPAIYIYDNNLGGSSDHFLGLFTAPLFLATARASTTFDRRYLILTAIMGAGALLTKYQASYVLPLCALLVMGGLVVGLARRIRRHVKVGASGDGRLSRADLRRFLVWPLVALGVFVLVVAPHFVRNWVFYSNPFYPFLQDVIPSNPTRPDAEFYFKHVFQDPNWVPQGTFLQRVTSSAELMATFSFVPSYYFYRTDWPIFGALFTYASSFVLFIRRPGRIWLGIIVCMGTVFMWAMTFRNTRNLQGFVPIMAAVTLALLVRAWQLGWFARLGVAVLVALQLVWGGDQFFYSQYPRLASAINSFRAGYEKTTAHRFKTHPLVQAGKTLPKDAKVVFQNNRPTLGLNRVVALDLTDSQALFSYAELESVQDLVREWRKGGITHVLYETQPFYGRESRKIDVLFTQFLQAAGPGRHFAHYGLIDIRKLRDLPAKRGQRVIMIGVTAYPHGVYPIASLSLNELLPWALRRYPSPEAPIPTDPAALEALVDGAGAALINGSPPVVAVLTSKRWSIVYTNPGYYSVYLPPR
jgi:hypothetical protein